jgi:hypothetical protein
MVADSWPFNTSKSQALKERLEKNFKDGKEYYKIVIEMACSCADMAADHRLYFGATYKNRDQYNGMYSFAPARKASKTFEQYTATDKGFPRVWLNGKSPFMTKGELAEFITTNNTQALKATGTNMDAIKTFWQKIRKISRDQGCVEGIQFDMPQIGE